MNTFLILTFIVSFHALIFCAYMLFRNNLVCKIQLKALDISIEEYEKLPSYNKMFWQIFKFKWKEQL